MSASSVDHLRTPPLRDVERLLSELDFSLQDLAIALEVGPRTVEHWFSGQTSPQPAAIRRLAELVAVYCHLRDTFTTVEAACDWFHSPHPYLGRHTPAEVARDGHFDRVEAALEALDRGIFV